MVRYTGGETNGKEKTCTYNKSKEVSLECKYAKITRDMSRQVHFTHVLTTIIIIINLMTTIVGTIILVLNVSWTFLCSSAAHLTSDVSYTSGHNCTWHI